MRLLLSIAPLLSLMLALEGIGAEPAKTKTPLPREAESAMRRAGEYYRRAVSTHGGYVYHYSLDLKRRWGEGEANTDQVWVQPPGTPTVGQAFLHAYEATGDTFYLDAAKDAANALIHGQLVSGGWTNSVDFNPKGEKTARYRNGKGRAKGPNNSTLDDGISQAAIRFILHLDKVLAGRDAAIHESAQLALESLLKAQFPNGGFPQIWTGPVSARPVLKASYPEGYDWRTEGKIRDYWNMYTLNDGLAGTVSATLLNAFELTGDVRCKEALIHLGDFLILAQMPDPQPAWAQQYGESMHPIWARRFEPPAVAGSESQDVLETLLVIYQFTRDPKYLEPFTKALPYLKKSVLADGRLARYQELKTNRPLYMNRKGKDYFLTYDDTNLPDHYGWKGESRLAEIEARYLAIKAGKPDPRCGSTEGELEQSVRKIIADLDQQGRWVSEYQGERLVGQPKFARNMPYLSSAVFSQNLETLSRYLKASVAKPVSQSNEKK